MRTPDYAYASQVPAPPGMAPPAAQYPGRLRRLAGSWVPAALIVLGLLSVWEGYVRLCAVPKWLLPAPSVIAVTLMTAGNSSWATRW